MKNSSFSITILGSRGSVTRGSPEFSEFGGDTSCYMVRAGDETVFLDAGSGLVHAPASYPKAPVILLSHLHLDHILGLGMYPGFTTKGQNVRLYVPFCSADEEAADQIERVFSPPLWPLKLTDIGAELCIRSLPSVLQIGDLCVETMVGNHPDRSMIFRLSYHSRSLVYATDYEHEDNSFDGLTDFSCNADLLLYDAQFTEKEYETRKGFGHSTAEKGLELFQKCGAGRMLLIHHSPFSTDRILRIREKGLLSEHVRYARQKETVELIPSENQQDS